MSETKLLPCPFCSGTHVEIKHSTIGDDESASVDCCESEACFASTGWHSDMEDAITAWNTRAPDPRIAAADAMAKAMESRIELACRGTCDRALDWHTPECESARAALAAYNALK